MLERKKKTRWRLFRTAAPATFYRRDEPFRFVLSFFFLIFGFHFTEFRVCRHTRAHTHTHTHTNKQTSVWFVAAVLRVDFFVSARFLLPLNIVEKKTLEFGSKPIRVHHRVNKRWHCYSLLLVQVIKETLWNWDTIQGLWRCYITIKLVLMLVFLILRTKMLFSTFFASS